MSDNGKPSQEQAILTMLRARGDHGLTPLAALREVGTFRLGARIFGLRRAGYNIETHRVRTEGGALIARYVLVE